MAVLLTAATFALGITSASAGKLLAHTKYDSYYGGYAHGKFFENKIFKTTPEDLGRATNPSYTTLNFFDNLDFPKKERNSETHIFSGTIHLPKCKAGVYKFRVTSDDDSTLLIDNQIVTSNPGRHGMQPVEGHATLHGGEDIHFELWWGNYGGSAGLKLEYCYHHVATQRIKKQLGSIDASGEANKLLAEMDVEELDSFPCHMTGDLWGLLSNYDVPTISRCDYDGYFKDDLKYFTTAHESTRHLPTSCVEEGGGIISGTDKPNWIMNSSGMSFTWSAKLKPRATGVHRFWATCNDACYLIISQFTDTSANSKMVVALPGTHDTQTRHGAIPMKKGVTYNLLFLYGNAAAYGEFRVQYQDPTMTKADDNFTPILV